MALITLNLLKVNLSIIMNSEIGNLHSKCLKWCICDNFRETECMLLDCGEDTYGQLYRNFERETPNILRHINSVFLSHLHADHHMGLYGILEKRWEAFQEVGLPPSPVYLLVTENVQDWLESLTHTLDSEVMSQVK